MKSLSSLPNRCVRFLFCENGSTATEYALIAAVVSIVIVAAVIGLGESVGSLFNTTANSME